MLHSEKFSSINLRIFIVKVRVGDTYRMIKLEYALLQFGNA